MKTIKTTIYLGCFTLLFSCQSAQKNSGEFRLLPQPQQFDIGGESRLLANEIRTYFAPEGIDLPVSVVLLKDIQPVDVKQDAQIIFSVDTTLDLKPEGYILTVSGKNVEIEAKDRAGLLYAFMTLEQLMEDAMEQDIPLPKCHIKDYPVLAYRAVHLDVKHHREKEEYYYRLMDNLAHYKVNAVIAEVEDKFGYQSEPAVGSADALSILQWKKLNEYAMERNIEISPLVQGLGHASFILKHEQYKDLRDDPESDWAFNPLDPLTYELQFNLYREALEAFPYGRYLHVGGDEVHTTGRNSGKSELELQLTWLNKVCGFAEENQRIPIFWDDMPLKYAGFYQSMFDPSLTRKEVDSLWKENEQSLLQFLDRFPKNCIYMRWNYRAPQTEGNIKAMEWFSDHGLKVMGATAGQTRWPLMPQDESNMENIRSFAVTSVEKGIDGLLLTLWDDDSPHFELYMRGILAFAEYAWSGDRRSKEEIKAAYRQREYSGTLAGPGFDFVDQLEPYVGWWTNALIKQESLRILRKLEDPLEEGIIDLPSIDEKGAWSEEHAARLEKAEEVMAGCKDVASKISDMKSGAIRNKYRLEVYEQVNELVRFSAHSLLLLREFDMAPARQEASEAMKQIRKLQDEFAAMRKEFENVYSQVRILTKPEGYQLDQDHHNHLANQTVSFDWQFTAELFFLEKIQNWLIDQ